MNEVTNIKENIKGYAIEKISSETSEGIKTSVNEVKSQIDEAKSKVDETVNIDGIYEVCKFIK